MRKSLQLKLTMLFSGITLCMCLLIVGTASWIFTAIDQTVKEIRYDDILDGYKTEVKSQVQSALTIVQQYYDKSKTGEMTTAEAKEQAKEAIRVIRYGDESDGYLWIDDTDYNLVMHPILPDQEGTNRRDLTDQNGVKIIREIMKVSSTGGFNEFYFTKSDGKTVAPKIAYSKSFDPWGWVITTGCYSDDIHNNTDNDTNALRIDKNFKGAIFFMIIESIVLIVVMIVVSTIMIRKITKVVNEIKKSMSAVAEGDLSKQFESKRSDELGVMVTHVNQTVRSFHDIISESLLTSEGVQSTNQSVSQAASSASEATQQIATAIEGIANDAADQATAITAMTNAVDEMQNETKEIADAAEEIGSYADKLKSNSESMRQCIESMKGGSHQMSEQISGIAGQINETAETINKMSAIIDSIGEISSQTNLLALNASIEAARAGEAGKGFAVVADSIKGLSENTASELDNIRAIIETLVQNFTACTKSIENVVSSNESNVNDTETVISSFNILDEDINETSVKVERIRSIIQSTLQEIQSIVNQVGEIEKSAESSAAASEEVTASSEELSALMSGVNRDVEELGEKTDSLVEKLNKFKL